MCYWGIGFLWDSVDVMERFLNPIWPGKERQGLGVVAVGWAPKGEEAAPDVNTMFGTLEPGERVYLKKLLHIKGDGNKLVIYAVGEIKEKIESHIDFPSNLYSDEDFAQTEVMKLRIAYSVKWYKVFGKDDFSILLRSVQSKNNVYNNTLYQEYNRKIIEDIEKRANLR